MRAGGSPTPRPESEPSRQSASSCVSSRKQGLQSQAKRNWHDGDKRSAVGNVDPRERIPAAALVAVLDWGVRSVGEGRSDPDRDLAEHAGAGMVVVAGDDEADVGSLDDCGEIVGPLRCNPRARLCGPGT